MSVIPKYDIKEFEKACGGDSKKIFVTKKALDCARDQFDLGSKKELLLFIAQDEFADLEVDSSELWREPPKEYEGCIVDAYIFYIPLKLHRCYMAFANHNTVKENWALKSFHTPHRGEAIYTSSPFAIAFAKANLLPRGGCE